MLRSCDSGVVRIHPSGPWTRNSHFRNKTKLGTIQPNEPQGAKHTPHQGQTSYFAFRLLQDGKILRTPGANSEGETTWFAPK